MRAYKYNYNGTGSVTKLNERQLRMLNFYQDVFKRFDDELVGVDNTFGRIETKSHGELSMDDRYLIGNLFGTSEEVVTRFLYYIGLLYKRIISPDIYLKRRLSDLRYKAADKAVFKSYQKYIDNLVTEPKCKKMVCVDHLCDFTFKVGKNQKTISYWIYKMEDEECEILFDVARGRDPSPKVLLDLFKSKLKLTAFKNELDKYKQDDFREFDKRFQQLKEEEEELLTHLYSKCNEELLRTLNLSGLDINDLSKVQININLEKES